MCTQVASPDSLLRFFHELVFKDSWPLERALPLLTKNAATVLKLDKKGEVPPVSLHKMRRPLTQIQHRIANTLFQSWQMLGYSLLFP